MDPGVVAAALEDPERAPITPRLRAGLAIVAAMTKAPGESYATVIARARDVGLDDHAIEDAANVAFHFNFINRVADAFDFDMLDPEKVSALARLLDRAKLMASRKRPSPTTIRTEEGIVRPVEVELGHNAVLNTPATVDPALRVAVESHCARKSGGVRPALEVPEVLHRYLDKLTRYAYRITDEDLDALRTAGFDKDAIFELTQAGAWGASVAALENILGELHRVRELPANEARPLEAVGGL